MPLRLWLLALRCPVTTREFDMARFDVCADPDAQERKPIPFFLDVQNEHIKGFQTRLMEPLWASAL